MKILKAVLPGLVVLAAVLALRVTDPFLLQEQVRLFTFDTYQRVSPRPYAPVPVRIVDIDDATLAREDLQWPWPRTKVAELVVALANAGAAVIAFDVTFSEPDRTSPGNVLRIWSAVSDVDTLAPALRDLPDHDELLADLVGQAGNVVLGYALLDAPDGARPSVRAGFAHAGADPRRFLTPYRGAVVNLPNLESAAAGHGFFSFRPHPLDLVTRAVPLVGRWREELRPSLAAESLRVFQGAGSYVVRSTGASDAMAFGGLNAMLEIRIGRFIVPTTPEGEFRLHFTRPVAERYLPAHTILDGSFDPATVEGAIVLIGTSATGLRDIRSSPLNSAMAGVEAHATAIEQILLGHHLVRPDWTDGAEFVFLVVAGLSLVFLTATAGAIVAAVAAVLVLALAGGGALYLFVEHRVLIDPVGPSVAALAIYLTTTLIGYARSERQRRDIRSAFRRYLTPALVERLAENPELLRLGGERREMTFLFCDIRGFTSIAEAHQSDPEGLTRLLNRFLTAMTDVIDGHRGTIDKYMGDAIMAFWNAPIDDPDHAVHACAAALEMQRALETLNAALVREATEEGRTPTLIRIGVGINSGPCLVGNLGSQQHFDYSVIGDAVNLASRLEGQSKAYDVTIVIGERTRELAPDFVCLELDRIAVVGKTQPTTIHTLLGDPGDPATAEIPGAVEPLVAAYRARDWAGVLEIADRQYGSFGGRFDKLIIIYAERATTFMADPPLEDWDGVYRARSK
ncbi:MAG: CHASE2 domain-containing protein [Rhodospirillales bacterium]